MQESHAALLLLPLLLIACSQPVSHVEFQPALGTGEVSGVVVDVDTGQPIEFANILLLNTPAGTFTKPGGSSK